MLALVLAADAWLLYGLLDRWIWTRPPLVRPLHPLLGIAALFEHWLVRLFTAAAAILLNA